MTKMWYMEMGYESSKAALRKSLDALGLEYVGKGPFINSVVGFCFCVFVHQNFFAPLKFCTTFLTSLSTRPIYMHGNIF